MRGPGRRARRGRRGAPAPVWRPASRSTAAGLRVGRRDAEPAPDPRPARAASPIAAAGARLFLALEPLWRVVDGDGDDQLPVPGAGARVGRALARAAARRSPRNARSLGVGGAAIETWATTIARRLARGRRGAGARRAARRRSSRGTGGGAPAPPSGRSAGASRSMPSWTSTGGRTRALGRDLDALNVAFDLTPPARPPADPGGVHDVRGAAAPPRRRDVVAGTAGRSSRRYVDGGLTELEELVHETGHAVHIAGIRTRPAFADWPDADAYTEALADVVALDLWRARLAAALAAGRRGGARGPRRSAAATRTWRSTPPGRCSRSGMQRDPARLPERRLDRDHRRTWLGIAPHPEWSWWAIARPAGAGPWRACPTTRSGRSSRRRSATPSTRHGAMGRSGDPGWYPWIREHLLRFGASIPSREQLAGAPRRPAHGGRAPRADQPRWPGPLSPAEARAAPVVARADPAARRG